MLIQLSPGAHKRNSPTFAATKRSECVSAKICYGCIVPIHVYMYVLPHGSAMVRALASVAGSPRSIPRWMRPGEPATKQQMGTLPDSFLLGKVQGGEERNKPPNFTMPLAY